MFCLSNCVSSSLGAKKVSKDILQTAVPYTQKIFSKNQLLYGDQTMN